MIVREQESSPAGTVRSDLRIQIATVAAAVGFVGIAVATVLPAGVHDVHWTLTVGRMAAMAALSLFMLQLALTARIHWLDRAFALDRVYRVHAVVGALGAILVSAHPLLVYWSEHHSASLEDIPLWPTYWPQLLGAGVLVLVWLIVCTAIWRIFLGLSYEAWRWVHRATFVVVAAAVVHAFGAAHELGEWGFARLFWISASGIYVAAAVWLKLVRPVLCRNRFDVVSVRPASHNSVAIELQPHGGGAFSHLPGQFVFVRFACKALPGQTHPFTISSPPSQSGIVRLTVKKSGDFTSMIDQLRPDDKVYLQGPFGKFSHVLLARPDQPLVMIAGGIGITPMLSMLGHLADSGDARAIKLIWANHTEADIAHRGEIDQLQQHLPNLTVHHAMSRQDNWPGEKGHIDRQMLDRLLSKADLGGCFLVCGPGAMMSEIRRLLVRIGVASSRIHSERFSL